MRHVVSKAAFMVAVVAIAAACDMPSPPSSTVDSYPLPNDPANLHMFLPAELGSPTRTLVLDVRVRPGDRLELLSANPIGQVSGADVAFYLSRSPDPSRTVFEPLEPLEGAVVSNDAAATKEATVGIVAEITPREQGRFELTDVRLGYRLNDGIAEQSDGITTTLAVCGGTTLCASP